MNDITNLNIHSFDFKYKNLATKCLIISWIGYIATHTKSCTLIQSFKFPYSKAGIVDHFDGHSGPVTGISSHSSPGPVRT